MTRARGLAGFASAISGPVNSTDVFVGVLTATSMTVSGSASIGGTVTYEDVSNVDSVGIITAQSGIHVSNGSVGIRTANPSGLLQVGADGGSNVIINTNTGVNINDGAINLYQATSNVNAAPFIISTDVGGTEVEKLRVTGGGFVGIGTDDPLRQLTVDSGGASSTGGILVKNGLYGANQDAPYLIAASRNFNGGTTNWGEYGFQHRFKSNSGGTARVTIDGQTGELFSVNNAGNVAIGTDTAGARLHVHRPADTAYVNSCILSRGADANFQFLVTNGNNSNSSGDAVTRFGMHYNGSGWDQFFQFNRGNGAQNGSLSYYNSNSTYQTLVLGAAGYIGNPARLSGSGTVGVNCNASGTFLRSSSDATLKENVTPIGSQYETVKALNPVTYTWIDTEFMGDQTELGFIAQEVQPHIPEVITSDVDGKLGLDYQKLTATLTKALQEAIAKIETLETKVAVLEGN
tara:strand:- start:3834 stop:5219 length:1386 start_codon:yes stop_codon:yes gene_type:complete